MTRTALARCSASRSRSVATPSQAVRLSAEDSLESGFLASYGEGGRLVGAIRIRQSAETERLLRSLISERAPADALARILLGRRS
jgi:hypothetical protein